MNVNWKEIRSKEFPALDKGDMVFLDAACVSLAPMRSIKAVKDFADYTGKNDEVNASAHHVEMDNKRNIAYQEAAKLLNADIEEIAIVESTSHGLNIAATSLELNDGDNILTTNLEFIQVALPWCAMKKTKDIEIRVVKTEDNRFTVEDFKKHMDKRTKILVISSVEWCNGWKMNLKEIGTFCKENGIYLVVDAVQELGVMNIDTKKIHVDMLTAGGHKWLNSPYGAGILYINKDLLPKIDPVYWGYLNTETPEGGWAAYWENPAAPAVNDWTFLPTARRFEIGGTSNYVGAITLGESLGLVNEIGINNIQNRVLELSDYCISKIKDVGGTLITHDEEENKAGIVIFRLYGDLEKDREVLRKLHEKRIFIAQRFTDYVGGFRVSCQYFNNENDFDKLFEEIKNIINILGKPDYK
ncbi:MAG: aminotransferase class V-fold PLP-dependent enzyme [Tissierellia bacterium]|nr:aminotransferase class V-fold PLP-dependent enzyme [Tissierellia bacterium]